ncbi:hemolysin III family protein [Chitinophaga sp. Cy-1792]|uniref:PAQR family membrane homeostasis protein TrhA n=1 Tax=Chitinophaga sp. Cy-1792 TaxID=2608339 RepID=UPI0014217AA4|nr:hemolysin III family protein [Chitinophaga sp. Cy-1792]NIG57101.1 hemolysin III family protein [Chitinophaga sp. Cy-1792]
MGIIVQQTYSRQQEIVNGLIHAAGVIFGVSALPVLTAIAATHGNTPGIVGAGIYSFCFILLFTNSTVYHLSLEPYVKKIFLVFDHISIYFLIAGTYTPFILVYLLNSFGITLLCILWGLTLVGVFFKVWFTGKFEILSTIIYLVMGWIMVVGGKRFFEHMSVPVISMLFAGGILYSAGVFFYVWDKYKYTHAVWHFLVLAAAVCHYVAVLLAV